MNAQLVIHVDTDWIIVQELQCSFDSSAVQFGKHDFCTIVVK